MVVAVVTTVWISWFRQDAGNVSEHQKNQAFLRILRPVALYASVAATAGVGAVGALYLQSGKAPGGEENPAVALHETQFGEFSSHDSTTKKSSTKPSSGSSRGSSKGSAGTAVNAGDHAAVANDHSDLSHAPEDHAVPSDPKEPARHRSTDSSHENADHGRHDEATAATETHRHSGHATEDSDTHADDALVADAGKLLDRPDLPALTDHAGPVVDPFSEEALGFAESGPASVVHPVPEADAFVDAETAEHVSEEHEDRAQRSRDKSSAGHTPQKKVSAEELFGSGHGPVQGDHNEPPQGLAALDEDTGKKPARSAGVSSAKGVVQEKMTLQAANLLTYADEQLAGGNYIPAMRALQQIRSKSQGPPGSAILFRLALCAEAAGRHSAALEAYRKISGTQTDPAWVGVSRYGEARCLAATGRHEGLQTDLLRRAVLDETELLPTVRNEVLHLVGRDLWREHTVTSTTDLLKDTTMAVPEWIADPGQLLKELPLLIHETPVPVGRNEFRVLSLSDTDPGEIRVRLNCGMTRIEPLLSNLIKGCRLRLDVSEAALETLQGRSQQIHVSDRSLALLLDGLTLPYELAWINDNGAILIRHRSEVSENDWRTSRLSAAERLLRHAVIDGPGSSQSGHSRLVLSTLLFEQKRAADAVQFLQVQLETDPRSVVETEAAFNLGKCLMLLNEREDARQAFLRSIDASGGLLDVRIAAYIFHSRLLVEDGKGKTATTTMMRGLSLARGSELEPFAALQLASIYLMLNNPQGANSVLMGRREELAEGPGMSGAAFVSALSRFRAAVLSDRREREGWAVVSALSEFHPAEACGGHWAVLVAEACDDLGLTEQALEYWRLALEKLPVCQLRNEVILRLSQRYEEEGQYQNAELLLASFNAADTDTAMEAKVHTAELALAERNPEKAIRLCRSIIDATDNAGIERQALRIMGQAYEAQENYQAAVSCFAGMLPAEESSPSDPKRNAEPSVQHGGH